MTPAQHLLGEHRPHDYFHRAASPREAPALAHTPWLLPVQLLSPVISAATLTAYRNIPHMPNAQRIYHEAYAR
jgi:hypothetical protein